jgi:hypothetical protein
MSTDFEEKRDSLIKITQFVLGEEAERIRDKLEENIVETALYWGIKGDGFASTARIEELIEKEIVFAKFPPIIINKILSRLLAKGSVVENEKGWYSFQYSDEWNLEKLLMKKREKLTRSTVTSFFY